MSCKAICDGDLSIIAGETQSLYFHLVDQSGISFDVTGSHAFFSVSEYVPPSSPLISKECIVNHDIVSIKLIPTDTLEIIPGKYTFQLTVINSDGDVEVPAQGFVFIQSNIDHLIVAKGGKK